MIFIFCIVAYFVIGLSLAVAFQVKDQSPMPPLGERHGGAAESGILVLTWPLIAFYWFAYSLIIGAGAIVKKISDCISGI